MFIEPRVLSFITTYQCTAACDHCCFSCSPRRNEYIPRERMESLIDQAAEIPSMRLIAFTGGECFLLGKSLDSLVDRASRLGLATRCISNAYWATSVSAAEKRIGALASAGLKEINLSTGGIHMRHVPVERVVNAAYASANAGLTVVINTETFSGSPFSPEMLANHPMIEEMISQKRILLFQTSWIMTGGVSRIAHLPGTSRFLDKNKSGCSTCLDALSVTPELDLMACCGFTMKKIPELKLGSVKERRLREVLSSAPDDFLKIWIHIEGPEKILEFVKAHESDYELPVQYAHPCETCYHLYHDDTVRSTVARYYHDVEKRISGIYFVDLASKSIAPAERP
jgi:hypothetical protein